MAQKRPIIGLTLGIRNIGKRGHEIDHLVLRNNYCDRIREAGGLPLPLPPFWEDAKQYIGHLHGLLITGGDFDVPPKFYGVKEAHPRTEPDEGRSRAEFSFVEAALARELPIFGICGGMQLMNVVLGGTLHQHVPDVYGDKVSHMDALARKKPAHKVIVDAGSQLHGIVGLNEIHVNSQHHQAVDKPGDGINYTARAEDGLVEALEIACYPFGLGVQWHPEYLIAEGDKVLFQSFVEASRLIMA